MALTAAGFEVVGQAYSGAEAEQLVQSAKPRLLLLDMYLPDFSGLDLVRRIKDVTSMPVAAFSDVPTA